MIGSRLAHYEITDLLGKGGMGEVYRARDTKLDRDVAIKVLPGETSNDPERIARFQREARTLATLQHTNVASIYGFEESEDARFLVMELVEGEDLDQRLQRGAVPIEEAVDIARQIAAGLEAAHDQGIVHRDLKPANVKVSPAGQVKILDFGLARAYLGDTSETGDPMNSPTLTAAMTQVGVVLGTAAYMSPEQARGKPIDRRADIWSFGVLVFEMVTGLRLFAGETVSDTLAGVLKTEIELSNLPKSCPPALKGLLTRCLDRDATSRLRDIGEARIVLEQPMDGAGAPEPVTRGRRGRFAAIGGLAGVIVGAILMWVLVPPSEESLPEREVRFSIPRESQTTPRSELSPDGTRFLFMNQGQLWVREIRSMEARAVPGTEGALVCTWSPDGRWIAYATLTELYKSRPDGSGRIRLCEIGTDLHSWAGSVDWTEDGRVVFAPGDAGLFSVGENGGDPKVLLAPEEDETDFHHVFVLPDDRGFLFHPHIDLNFDSIHLFTGTERREILRHEGQQLSSAAYIDGHILYDRSPDNIGIWAVPFSLASLETTGEPFLVIPDASHPTVSRVGDLAFVPQSDINQQIVVLDKNGLVAAEIGEAIPGAGGLAVSPDGREAAFILKDKNYEIWMVDLATGDRQRFTFRKEEIHNLAWTADGQSIVFAAGRGVEMHQEIHARDGSSRSSIAVRGMNPSLTRDGRTLVLEAWDESNSQNVGFVDLEDPELSVTMIQASSFSESVPRLSPDDRFVAYESLESGQREVIVESFPDGKGMWEISREGGARPFWSETGDKLYFQSMSNTWLYGVDVFRDPVRFGAPQRIFRVTNIRGMHSLPDDRFIALRSQAGDQQGQYEIWLNWADGVGD